MEHLPAIGKEIRSDVRSLLQSTDRKSVVSDKHQNGARYPVCAFHTQIPVKVLISTHNLVPFNVGVQPNFVTVPNLSG